MRVTGVGFFGMIVIKAIVVKVKNQKSPMALTQNMNDGSRVRMGKSHSRTKDAESIDSQEGCRRPAQKPLFQARQHVV